MKTRILYLLITTILAAPAFGDVPYLFTAGEAAIADHVNQNFTYLDDLIEGYTADAQAEAESISTSVDTLDTQLQSLANDVETQAEDMSALDGRVTNLEGNSSCMPLADNQEDVTNQVSYTNSEYPEDGNIYYNYDGNTRWANTGRTFAFNPYSETKTQIIGPMYPKGMIEDKDNCFASTLMIQGYPAKVILTFNPENYGQIFHYENSYYLIASVWIKIHGTVYQLGAFSSAEYAYTVFNHDADTTTVYQSKAALIDVTDDLIDYLKIGNSYDPENFILTGWFS